ncbi:MAG: pentapeptide repeat protein [Acidimicrobiales bacterium]|nr:pentapeptide repeat protein [Acidimicrobiales bacterium]
MLRPRAPTSPKGSGFRELAGFLHDFAASPTGKALAADVSVVAARYSKQLSHRDLSGADLSFADLSDADLSFADLSGADLSQADLSRADLSYAKLSGTDLSGANLSGAKLAGSNHWDATGASIWDAHL